MLSTKPQPQETAKAFLAMNDAIAMAGISPKSIDYINAHGTGTPDNDSSESAAIRRLFNMDIPPVSSTKSFTGHTTSASGSIEAVICLLAVHHRFIPTNLNWSNGSDECIVPYQGEGQVSLHHVLCNSFGFGGNDSALVLSDKEVLLEETRLSTIKTEAESEVFAEDDLKEIRRYISPIEARRMSKIMKASLLTSMYALEKAGVENPDAIIIATRYGMLEQGEKILNHLVQSGEEGCSPTLFMQSTHNTIAGSLAIRLKCHGYNITYSHGDESLSLAIKDARLLISEGKAKSVLIGVHDQCPDTFRNLYKRAGSEETAELYSKSLVITHD